MTFQLKQYWMSLQNNSRTFSLILVLLSVVMIMMLQHLLNPKLVSTKPVVAKDQLANKLLLPAELQRQSVGLVASRTLTNGSAIIDDSVFVPTNGSAIIEDSVFVPTATVYGATVFNLSNFNADNFKDRVPVIPHIIHQIWDTHKVPEMFVKWIQSIAEKHPDWEYWFWTIGDAECLIRTKYPHHLHTFQRYLKPVFKTDAFRYFALYEYGGIYIDLDVEALQALDFWTYAFPAVISWENYEHSYLLHNKKKPNIMTTVLASKPKHPFFQVLQQGLAASSGHRNVLQATGPFFLHSMYEKFQASNRSTQPENRVVTINPKYWLPRFGPSVKARTMCQRKFKLLTDHGKKVCEELEAINYVNSIKPDSFLNHFWAHTMMWSAGQKLSKVKHIKDIVPNVKLVSTLLQC